MAKTKRNNADYWRQRAEAVAEEAHKNADKAVKDAQGYFREAEISTRRQIESWYARFAAENQISLSEAHKRLDARELEEFKWTVDQYIKAAQNGDLSKEWIQKLKNASVRVHIDRLEAVLLSIEAELERCYGQYADRTEEHLKDVITEGYTRTCFDTQKGVGAGWDIAGIDSAKVDSMIRKPWTTDSKTFRDRVWQDKDQLVNYVHKDLTQAILRGDSLRNMTDRMSERLQVPKHKAARLIHTETTYFNAQAAKESYKALDVEEVQIIGTLDNLTCPECGGMDHQVVPVNRMEPGVSVPPFHPNCRCTTAPVDEFADEFDTRVARKEDGETYEIPSNMSYEEWKEKFVDGGSKEGLEPLTVPETEPKEPEKDRVPAKDLLGASIEGYTPEQQEELKAFIDRAPEHVRALYAKYASELKPPKAEKKGKAYHSFGNVHLDLGSAASGSMHQVPYQVHFHEYAHCLDFLARRGPSFSPAYKNSAGEYFEDVIMKNWETTMQKFYADHVDLFDGQAYNKKRVLGAFIKYMNANYTLRARGNLSDMLERYSVKVLQRAYPLDVGHGKTYAKRQGALAKEAFAEMMDAEITNPESLELIKEYLPDAYDMYLTMIKEMLT